MSRLPPTARGGTTECWPGSAGALSRLRRRERLRGHPTLQALRSQAPSLKDRRSKDGAQDRQTDRPKRPKPRRCWQVHPEARWDKLSRKAILSASPRLRPLHVDWPGHGIDAAKIDVVTSAAVEPRLNCRRRRRKHSKWMLRLARLAFERRSEVAAPGELYGSCGGSYGLQATHIGCPSKSVAKSRRRAPMEPVAGRRRIVDAAEERGTRHLLLRT